jgi:hypothetical protein
MRVYQGERKGKQSKRNSLVQSSYNRYAHHSQTLISILTDGKKPFFKEKKTEVEHQKVEFRSSSHTSETCWGKEKTKFSHSWPTPTGDFIIL